MQAELQVWKQKGRYFNHNGYKIFYITEGAGDNLLIVHGYPYSTIDWYWMWVTLISRYLVIAPDMLGMGFSDKPTNYTYSFEDHVEMYLSLLESLKINEVSIFAHDLGNSVVQELLSLQLEGKVNLKIKLVAFLNGGLFSDVYRPRPIQILLSKSPKPIGKLISRIISKKAVSKASSEVFGPNTKPDDGLLQIFWEILNYKNGKRIVYLIGRLVFAKDRYQDRWIYAMQNTNVPMCFINGPADPNSGQHMVEKYKQTIPNPVIHLLDNSIGHWPQIEDPKGTLKAFLSFSDKVKENHNSNA